MPDHLVDGVLTSVKNIFSYEEHVSGLVSRAVLSVPCVLGYVQHLKMRSKCTFQHFRKTNFVGVLKSGEIGRNTENWHLKSASCEVPVASFCSGRLG
jgi:hypothetical protein